MNVYLNFKRMGSFGFWTIVTTLQCYNNAEFPLEFPKQDFQCKIQFVRLLDWFSIVSVRSPIASSANLVRRIRTILLNEHLVTSKWIIWLKSILAGMNLQLSIFFSGSTSGSWRPFFHVLWLSSESSTTRKASDRSVFCILLLLLLWLNAFKIVQV